jgi:hypothetical protein
LVAVVDASCLTGFGFHDIVIVGLTGTGAARTAGTSARRMTADEVLSVGSGKGKGTPNLDEKD